MNTPLKLALGTALLVLAAAGGYWSGTQHDADAVSTQADSGGRKLLYYRNPMGLPDTSPVPKKDSMGMDYIPVYEGEAPDDDGAVSVSPARVQMLGVKSEAVAMRTLGRTLRLNARIEADERRLYTIAPKFDGWVEKMYVNTSGQRVRKGEPLFDVYSPELVSALRELALAKQGVESLKEADAEARQGMQRLADASAARLKNWDIADAELRNDRVLYRAPADGIVLEKTAVEGMRFMPGEALYRIADLSTVWVMADVPEQQLDGLHPGNPVEVSVEAWPGRTFSGNIDFIYPVLDVATRTVPLRIVLRNADGALKPAMYAHVEVGTGKGEVLAIPVSAVIDSGTRQTVLVRIDNGRFAPRAVTLGSRSNDYVEVTNGLQAGEQVVTSANFLLDSESNLKAAFSGMEEAPAKMPKNVGHIATGVLEEIYDDSNVSITHEPIPSLKWPAMTMDFELANPSLAANIEPGSAIKFEIVERGEGEWVITRLQKKEQNHAEHRH